jgi:hypothetical protein
LNVEFFAGHQIEFGEKAAHHHLGVLFDVLGRRIGQQGADLGAEFFECLGVEHDVLRGILSLTQRNFYGFGSLLATGA